MLCQVCEPTHHFSLVKKRCVECPTGAVVQGSPLGLFACGLLTLALATIAGRLLYKNSHIITHVAEIVVSELKGEDAGAEDVAIMGALRFLRPKPPAREVDPVTPRTRFDALESDPVDLDDVALLDERPSGDGSDSRPRAGGAPNAPDMPLVEMDPEPTVATLVEDGDDEGEAADEVVQFLCFKLDAKTRRSLLTKFKIIIGVYQILNALPWSLPMVTLPEAFQTMIEWASVLPRVFR